MRFMNIRLLTHCITFSLCSKSQNNFYQFVMFLKIQDNICSLFLNNIFIIGGYFRDVQINCFSKQCFFYCNSTFQISCNEMVEESKSQHILQIYVVGQSTQMVLIDTMDVQFMGNIFQDVRYKTFEFGKTNPISNHF